MCCRSSQAFAIGTRSGTRTTEARSSRAWAAAGRRTATASLATASFARCGRPAACSALSRKLAVLTAQRKEKTGVRCDSTMFARAFGISPEDRQKGTGEALPLPQLALDVIEDQRRANPESPFVFAASRSTLTRAKKAFETAHPWPQWQLHDLRRSSRSLMAAAGVPDLVAELVLGHRQRGVAAIYNRHGYLTRKAMRSPVSPSGLWISSRLRRLT